MPIKIIAAMAKRTRAIGKDNKIPRSVPEDMEFFRNTIKDQIIVMGKNTYDSLKTYYPDHHGHPLAKENIVITHHDIPGVKTYDQIDFLINDYEQELLYVIGGENIYKKFIDLADEILLTLIHKPHKGDTFFPEFEQHYDKVGKKKGKQCDFLKYVSKK